jgi:hypothetical protein
MFRRFNIQRSKLMYVVWKDGYGNFISDVDADKAARTEGIFFARKSLGASSMSNAYHRLGIQPSKEL